MWKFNWKECADCLLKRIWEILTILSPACFSSKVNARQAASYFGCCCFAHLYRCQSHGAQQKKCISFILAQMTWEVCWHVTNWNWQFHVFSVGAIIWIFLHTGFIWQTIVADDISTRQRSEGILFVGMHALRIHWILWTELGFSLYRNRHRHFYIAQNVASLLFTGWHQDPVARWSQFLFNV